MPWVGQGIQDITEYFHFFRAALFISMDTIGAILSYIKEVCVHVIKLKGSLHQVLENIRRFKNVVRGHTQILIKFPRGGARALPSLCFSSGATGCTPGITHAPQNLENEYVRGYRRGFIRHSIIAQSTQQVNVIIRNAPLPPNFNVHWPMSCSIKKRVDFAHGGLLHDTLENRTAWRTKHASLVDVLVSGEKRRGIRVPRRPEQTIRVLHIEIKICRVTNF
mmetsp:Transcript_38267/g.66425  ORF Transcript_38267/g.66425 Transcript_38267/m.66425 type:complete len:221 (-) Transcript_38267:990-1652(-)